MRPWSAALFLHLVPEDAAAALYAVRNDSGSRVAVWQKRSPFQDRHAVAVPPGPPDRPPHSLRGVVQAARLRGFVGVSDSLRGFVRHGQLGDTLFTH